MKTYHTAWTVDDIEVLLLSRAREGKSIDYKKQLPRRNEDVQKLLADVSAFANAEGGAIVFGVEEDDGEPTNCCGVGEVDFDREKLRLGAIIADNLDPALRGHQFDPITMPSGAGVLVLRIPQSPAAPHRIAKGTPKFYLRGDGLNIPMSSYDLRSAFLASSSLEEKARAFVEGRCELLSQRKLPFRLNSTGHALLHIIPIASLMRSVSRSIADLQTAVGTLWPPQSESGCCQGFCLEGLLSTSFDGQGGVYSHVLTFRSGILEASYPCRGTGAEQKQVRESWYLKNFNHRLPAYEEAIRKLGCNPPYLISLSLVDCQGTTPWVSTAFRGEGSPIALMERIQTFPILEWAADVIDWTFVLRHFSDLYANLSGSFKSLYFSEDGSMKRI